MSEHIVDFGDDAKSAVRMAMARQHGAVVRDEIVRCRDCAYSIHFLHHDDERWQCIEHNQEGDDVKPDGYCWRGKQKEDSDD